MNIIFMGNPGFSVAGLQALHDSDHSILAVVTNPAKPKGRGRASTPTPVCEAARALGIPVMEVSDLKDPNFQEDLKQLEPDLFVVVAFRILPKSLIAIPRLGCINLHTSLLPKYRGAAPIQRALMNGDIETGVTTFIIEPKVDTGDILLQKKVPIRESDDFGTLSERLSLIGANVLLDTVDRLESGSLTRHPQDNSRATPAPKIFPEDCQINWSKPALAIHNQIRALSPRPGAFTFWGKYRLKIFVSKPTIKEVNLNPGQGRIDHHQLFIQTGQGVLELLELQREGKSRITAREFIRGYGLKDGITLG